MCQFIETIKIKNAIIKNLSYHQRRVIYTIHRFFKSKPFSIKKILLEYQKQEFLKQELFMIKRF